MIAMVFSPRTMLSCDGVPCRSHSNEKGRALYESAAYQIKNEIVPAMSGCSVGGQASFRSDERAQVGIY